MLYLCKDYFLGDYTPVRNQVGDPSVNEILEDRGIQEDGRSCAKCSLSLLLFSIMSGLV